MPSKRSTGFPGGAIPILLIATVLSNCAGLGAARSHPGYVDYSSLSTLAGDNPGLQFDVHVFESSHPDNNLMASTMSEIMQGLDRQNWDRIVRVHGDEDRVDVYLRLSADGELIHGIALMVTSPGETLLVNVVGDINPGDIGSLARRLGIEELAGLSIPL
jgi:hypothetical protein